jgi:hypothetical protein
MTRLLTLFLTLLAGFGQARAQDRAEADDLVRGIYAGMEDNVRREYAALLAAVERGETGGPGANYEKTREMIKTIYYNKAALFAFCAADAEQAHSAGAERVPAERNLALTTCVEVKFAALNKFANAIGYANIFFPGRIDVCGERARLAAQEKVLPPYGFLQLAEPKLYDFARYNECLMTPQ